MLLAWSKNWVSILRRWTSSGVKVTSSISVISTGRMMAVGTRRRRKITFNNSRVNLLLRFNVTFAC